MSRHSPANRWKLGPPSHLEVMLFWIVGMATTILSGGVAIYVIQFDLGH